MHFLEGEQVGHSLAQVISSQRESSYVCHLKSSTGEDVFTSTDILSEFYANYRKLYTSVTFLTGLAS